MLNLPAYREIDFIVRRAVAASGIVKIAVSSARHARMGSVDINKQKALELAVSQFECIKCYEVGSENNIITEDQLESIFSNIANITGCGYAPLGTNYQT